MKKIVIFVDSDVVISSLLSSKGASYFLLNTPTGNIFFISNYSYKELLTVANRLGIPEDQVMSLEAKNMKKVEIEDSIEDIKNKYGKYTYDVNDAHIVAGVDACRANFLITYNTKDFKAQAIKDKFNCVITTPSNFLQYLRSI